MTISKAVYINEVIEELKRLQIEHGNIECVVSHIRENDDGEEIFVDKAWPEFRNNAVAF